MAVKQGASMLPLSSSFHSFKYLLCPKQVLVKKKLAKKPGTMYRDSSDHESPAHTHPMVQRDTRTKLTGQSRTKKASMCLVR